VTHYLPLPSIAFYTSARPPSHSRPLPPPLPSFTVFHPLKGPSHLHHLSPYSLFSPDLVALPVFVDTTQIYAIAPFCPCSCSLAPAPYYTRYSRLPLCLTAFYVPVPPSSTPYLRAMKSSGRRYTADLPRSELVLCRLQGLHNLGRRSSSGHPRVGQHDPPLRWASSRLSRRPAWAVSQNHPWHPPLCRFYDGGISSPCHGRGV
jgi:hypothetical protein